MVDYGRRVVVLDWQPTPADFAGLEDAMAAFKAALQPATATERAVCFGELATVFPMAETDEGVENVRWAAYHKALDDMPADVLADACAKLMKTATFFPKPAEIRAAAAETWGKRIMAVSRLRALKSMKIEVRELARADPTPEQKARVRALVSGAIKGLE